MISIPDSFKLGGRTWTVMYHDEISGDPKICGDADSSECVIRIRAEMSDELTQHTFYHELCHAMCYSLGWSKLNKDEDKIDALGSVLLQFQATRKGRLE